MRIAEAELELMNRRLHEWYGETESLPHFRIVWSEDQLEKRITQYTNEGLQLLRPEVRELPKYKQWIQAKYLIEKLTIVPQYIETDLVEKLSYEPLFVFENGKGEYLPPRLEVARIAIENVMSNLSVPAERAKYIDPDLTPGTSREHRSEELRKMQEELFGNETDIGDALATRSGVAYGPGSSPNSSTPAIKMEYN